MEYEFGNIEALIKNAFTSGKTGSVLKENLAKARKSLDEEKHSIKKNFALKVLSIEDKGAAASYVQFHQYSLICFIDEIFELAKKQSAKKDSRLSMEAFFFYDQLEDILNFIRQQFPAHFSENTKIPETQKQRFLNEIKRVGSTIKANLVSKKIDQILVSVCLHPMLRLLNKPEEEITYQKISFIKVLTTELQGIIESNPSKGLMNDVIRELLLSLDYNDESYLHYYIDLMKVNLEQAKSTREKLEALALHMKMINQSLQTREVVYDFKSPPIRQQLSDWICNEVLFLETLEKITQTKPTTAEDFVKNEFKIKVAISVSQFACLIRVFTEAGIIENKNISELIRFFTKFIETKRSEKISTESFRIKYYNLESSTKIAVKNLFHTAISYINSN